MNGSFNGQVLVDKLTKLNNGQQSIETLSHWCIFHRKKAKQVVETWQQQFYCAPRDQRISFLYLANDILQNSRWKGLEFIDEFWKVIPGALSDVFNNGGEIGRSTVVRLMDIWEERKVFGSHGQVLKDNILGSDNGNKNINEKVIRYKLKHPSGEQLEELISGYTHIYDLPYDEDTLYGNCQAATNLVDEVDKELVSELGGNSNGSGVVRKMQVQHGVLRECIEQLKVIESLRATLITYLRKALHEQESKFEQVHQQLQAAQSRYEQSVNLHKQLGTGPSSPDQRLNNSSAFPDSPPKLIPQSGAGTRSQTTAGRYSQDRLPGDNNAPVTDRYPETAAAAVAPQFAASTSTSQMLIHVHTSPASDGIFSLSIKEDHPTDNKRLKLEDNVPPPLPQLRPLLPSFLHPDLLNQPPPLQSSFPVTQPSSRTMPPPPPFLPMPLPPPPPTTPQFMQFSSGPTMPFGYGSVPFPNYPMHGMQLYPSLINQPYGLQSSEGFIQLGQPPLPTAPPPPPPPP
ncbi:uncharacterized protein LOC135634997 [Musa acuminata AAA Group]|uniref:uncharacterized protein LOC135634997 n=1 Tax=Musa acuminata AAA Group TaxID=214697 RepID=UPI0031D66C89